MTKEEFLNNESAWLRRVYGIEMSPEDLDETYNFWIAHDMAHHGPRGTQEGQISWEEFSEAKAMMVLDMRDMLVQCLTEEETEDCKAPSHTLQCSSLSFSLSFSLSLSLSLSLSMCARASVCLSVCLSVCPFTWVDRTHRRLS